MKKNLLVVLFFYSSITFAGLSNLAQSGFKCVGTEGIRCTGKLKNYPFPVSIVFNREALSETPNDVAIFLHGLIMQGQTVQSDVINRFKFENKVQKMSGAFAMIIPHFQTNWSSDPNIRNTRTHLSPLYKESTWKAFVSEFLNLISKDDYRPRLHLFSHSAGYRVLARRGTDSSLNLDSLIMIDSAYGNSSEISQFKNKNIRQWVSYYRRGTDTDAINQSIMANLSGKYVLKKGSSQRPQEKGITFISTGSQEVGHWEMVDVAFRNFYF